MRALRRGGHPRRGHRPAASPSSLGFGEQTAADVMSPRARASSIERTATADDVVRLARRTGHSRFPVDRRGLGRHRRRRARQAGHRRAARAPRRRAGVGAHGAAAARARDDPARPAPAHAARARAAARHRRRRVRRHRRHRHPRGRRRGDRRRGLRRARRLPHDRVASSPTARGPSRASGGPTRCASGSAPRCPTGRPTRRPVASSWPSSAAIPVVGDTRRRRPAGRSRCSAMDGMRADRLRFVPAPTATRTGGRRRGRTGVGRDARRRCEGGARERRRRLWSPSCSCCSTPSSSAPSSPRWRPAARQLEPLAAAGSASGADLPRRPRADGLAARLRPARHHGLLGAARCRLRGGPAPRARARRPPPRPARGRRPTGWRSRSRCSSSSTCTSSSAR